MQAIRDELCTRLALPARSLRIANYPVGPSFKHIYWWREGGTDYAEAQFFAEVSKSHPVLSLGVAVEKGREDLTSPVPLRRPEQLMDRRTWDWPRLVQYFPNILATEVVAAAASLRGSVNVRIRSKSFADPDTTAWETRTFSLVDGSWFERHRGHTEPAVISEHVRELNGQPDSWAIVHFACDLSPAETDGLTASGAADILMAFNSVRRRLRP